MPIITTDDLPEDVMKPLRERNPKKPFKAITSNEVQPKYTDKKGLGKKHKVNPPAGPLISSNDPKNLPKNMVKEKPKKKGKSKKKGRSKKK